MADAALGGGLRIAAVRGGVAIGPAAVVDVESHVPAVGEHALERSALGDLSFLLEVEVEDGRARRRSTAVVEGVARLGATDLAGRHCINDVRVTARVAHVTLVVVLHGDVRVVARIAPVGWDEASVVRGLMRPRTRMARATRHVAGGDCSHYEWIGRVVTGGADVTVLGRDVVDVAAGGVAARGPGESTVVCGLMRPGARMARPARDITVMDRGDDERVTTTVTRLAVVAVLGRDVVDVATRAVAARGPIKSAVVLGLVVGHGNVACVAGNVASGDGGDDERVGALVTAHADVHVVAMLLIDVVGMAALAVGGLTLESPVMQRFVVAGARMAGVAGHVAGRDGGDDERIGRIVAGGADATVLGRDVVDVAAGGVAAGGAGKTAVVCRLMIGQWHVAGVAGHVTRCDCCDYERVGARVTGGAHVTVLGRDVVDVAAGGVAAGGAGKTAVVCRLMIGQWHVAGVAGHVTRCDCCDYERVGARVAGGADATVLGRDVVDVAAGGVAAGGAGKTAVVCRLMIGQWHVARVAGHVAGRDGGDDERIGRIVAGGADATVLGRDVVDVAAGGVAAGGAGKTAVVRRLMAAGNVMAGVAGHVTRCDCCDYERVGARVTGGAHVTVLGRDVVHVAAGSVAAGGACQAAVVCRLMIGQWHVARVAGHVAGRDCRDDERIGRIVAGGADATVLGRDVVDVAAGGVAAGGAGKTAVVGGLMTAGQVMAGVAGGVPCRDRRQHDRIGAGVTGLTQEGRILLVLRDERDLVTVGTACDAGLVQQIQLGIGVLRNRRVGRSVTVGTGSTDVVAGVVRLKPGSELSVVATRGVAVDIDVRDRA